MKEHALKCWPQFFGQVATGRKTFEVRHAGDRAFEEGDVLVLREWNPETEEYSGRQTRQLVTTVFNWDADGLGRQLLAPDAVVLGIRTLDEPTQGVVSDFLHRVVYGEAAPAVGDAGLEALARELLLRRRSPS